jgi:hypothetical protein
VPRPIGPASGQGAFGQPGLTNLPPEGDRRTIVPPTHRPPSLDLDGFAGLTEHEVALRLAREGPNELPSRENRGLLAIVLEVVREGQQRRIPGRDVVPGDLVIVAEGDRVPADALLRAGINLSVDESLLTGESVPVRKTASAEAQALDAPGGDDLPSLFSGSCGTEEFGRTRPGSWFGRPE